MNRSLVQRTLVGAATLVATLAACTPSESENAQAGATGSAAGAPAGATAAAAPPAQTTSGFVHPDSATRDQLLAIPGMNAATADALVAARPYQSMTAVDRILAQANLTEQQRDTIYTRLWKPIDLNTATDAEILLIPGVGPRMQREFKEYRPYRTMEQFRREIGKYVRPEEVARLERYVMIRGQ